MRRGGNGGIMPRGQSGFARSARAHPVNPHAPRTRHTRACAYNAGCLSLYRIGGDRHVRSVLKGRFRCQTGLVPRDLLQRRFREKALWRVLPQLLPPLEKAWASWNGMRTQAHTGRGPAPPPSASHVRAYLGVEPRWWVSLPRAPALFQPLAHLVLGPVRMTPYHHDMRSGRVLGWRGQTGQGCHLSFTLGAR